MLALLCVIVPSWAADEYRTYTNSRFGTTVQYPANLLIPRPEAQNGDGRRFVSKDELIEMAVYASHNVAARSAKTEMERAIADWKRDGGRLTYYKWETGWYTASGYIGDDIFYEKALLKDGVFHTLIWQYPMSFKARLDAPLTRSVRSFSTGRGADNLVSGKAQTQKAQAPKVQNSKQRRRVTSKTKPVTPVARGY